MACLLLMVACQRDDHNNEPKPDPSSYAAPKVDKDMFELTSDQAQFTFSIENKGNWEVSTDVGWLTTDKIQGYGNGQVTVDCAANQSIERRVGKITITNTANKQITRVSVLQTGRPRETANLVSHRAIIGNYIKDEKSYIEMTFDKPVKVESISIEWYDISGTTPEYSEDRCTVRYEFLAAGYGREVKSKVTIVSDDGIRTQFDLTFGFYDKHYPVEGEIRGTKVSTDEHSLWIATSRPSKLIEMSLADGSILHETDMPFAPGKISINPYNGMLYVMPLNLISDLGFDNRFCMVDPKNGVIAKTFTIERSAKYDPQYPPIYPYELEFTRDGLGILMLCSKESTLLEWRYVDSADGNKITATEYDWSTFWFQHVYQGCNQQSVYANAYYNIFSEMYQVTRQQPVPKLYELDPKFKSSYEYAGGYMTTMLYHRYRNCVFIATSPCSQCVVNLDNMHYSEVTGAEARGTKAAWDYSDPSRNLIYYVGGSNRCFLLLDMDKADCLYFTDCIWDDNCIIDYLEKTDQVVIADLYGVYLISTAEMKK